jgi:aryl-alcohol dehydrogenase-like predicted oxidoreductase
MYYLVSFGQPWRAPVDKRRIGDSEIGPLGLGCMNLSHAYGAPLPREDGIRIIRRALDLGVTHFDTAALYGFGKNEDLVGEALGADRKRIFLSSKCGMAGVDGKRVIDGRPETITRTCEDALKRLRTDVIDLYYLHRWDRNVPIEDSVGALSGLVRAGKVRMIGLSEVSAATIRRAHAVHPIAAVQSEYSLFTRNPEIAVLDTCSALGAAFVAFSPLSRGLLTSAPPSSETLSPQDIRTRMPRFTGDALAQNRALALRFRDLAASAGYAPAQLALSWVLSRAPHIHAIPGTTSVAHLEENLRRPAFTAEILERAGALIEQRLASGPRYDAATQTEIDTEDFA